MQDGSPAERCGSFAACSTYAHHPNAKVARRNYLGEIDHFAVFCLETAGVYLIPIADITVQVQGALHVDPPRNSQRRRIRYAADYEIGTLSCAAPARGVQTTLAMS